MRSLRLAVLPLLAGFFLHAATLEKLTLDEMIQKSTAIVRGQVLSSYAAAQGSFIYTHYRIHVTDRWKGGDQAELDVVVPGGTAGGLRQTFSGAPTLKPGSEYLLFLWTGRSGLTHVMGLTQGLFDLHRAGDGDLMAFRPATTELMLDSEGKLVKDAPLSLRLKDLRGRVARAQVPGGAR